MSADFTSRMEEAFTLAIKVKAALKVSGRRRGWTKCPRCGGKVRAILAGSKGHLHMRCETADCISVME